MGRGSRIKQLSLNPFFIGAVCILFGAFVFYISDTSVSISKTSDGITCKGRQWKSSQEELDCRYPKPPHGRWHAVYSEEFAKKHNLPLENISTDLSPGVDYMEMDVQPYGNGGTACLVNMLIKKPNDVAVYNPNNKYQWGPEYHAQRKLAHMLDLDSHKEKLRGITTFGFTTRGDKYSSNRSYSIGSSFAFHGRGIVDGYDYFSVNSSCYHILKYKKGFPDKWALNYAKASVWGREEVNFSHMYQAGRPHGEDFFNSRVYINIPKEIISEVFKGMPIGGRE